MIVKSSREFDFRFNELLQTGLCIYTLGVPFTLRCTYPEWSL